MDYNKHKKSLCFVTTEHYNVDWHLHNLINGLIDDYELIVIGDRVSINAKNFDNVKFIDVPIRRKISIFHDLYSLFALFTIFLIYKPTFIHSTMPKSGFLTSIAGFLSFRKFVVHTFTGQVWANYSGIKRKIFIAIDRLIVNLNSTCLTDSQSQSEYLFNNGISIKKRPLQVLGKGSLMGSRFSTYSFESDQYSKGYYGFREENFVLLYLARKSKDKGCFAMIDILNELLKKDNSYRLLFVGPDETDGYIFEYINKFPGLSSFIHSIDRVENTLPLIMSSDLLCAPSCREGFGTIIIDSAFAQLPAVASDIAGFRDSIVHKNTGILCDVNSIQEFVNQISFLKENPIILSEFGDNARRRANSYFSANYLVSCYKSFYKSL